MLSDFHKTRRDFLLFTGAAGAGLFFAGCSGPGEEQKKGTGEIVPLAEELMREHGVLSRLLMIYEESLRRLDAHMELPPQVIPGAVEIVQNFIQKFHENQEEAEVFPHFIKANKLVELVTLLKVQHQAGREITEQILEHASNAALKELETRRKLNSAVRQFVRMYRAHANREDTVLFPALRTLVSAGEYKAMSGKLAQSQLQALGEGAFEKTVAKVAAIEKMLAMDNLAAFSPDAS